MGMRCSKQGFTFVWLPYKAPCIVTPNGEVIPLDSEGDVPCVKVNGLWQRLGGDQSRIYKECGVIMDAGVLKLTHHQYPAVPGPEANAGNGPSANTGAKSSSGGKSTESGANTCANSGDEPANTKKSKTAMDTGGSNVLDAGEDSDGSTCIDDDQQSASDAESEKSDASAHNIRKSLYEEANTVEHYLRHKKSLPEHCAECRKAKMKRKRRHKDAFKRDPTKFGEVFTYDHVWMKDWLGYGGIYGNTGLLNMYDVATGCKYAAPVTGSDTFETYVELNHVKGGAKISNVYCDNYPSLIKAARQCGATCENSQPGVHHSNAIIERQNGELLDGIRVSLLQAGMPACFWPFAAPCYCHLENIAEDETESRPGLIAMAQNSRETRSPWVVEFNSFRHRPKD